MREHTLMSFNIHKMLGDEDDQNFHKQVCPGIQELHGTSLELSRGFK